MSATTPIPATAKAARWIGYALSAVAVLFLLFDSIIKVLNLSFAVESTVSLGYPATVLVPLGILQLICLVLYLIPQTAVLGAILMTGYLGGAIATHVRLENPLFTHVLFPVYLGLLIWGGLYLRNQRLRELLPWQRKMRKQ
ncbi:MAG: DoxX family protein [Caldilineaceae bacterium]|nr:DoxX family protein [Caldilineaceae bacterium]